MRGSPEIAYIAPLWGHRCITLLQSHQVRDLDMEIYNTAAATSMVLPGLSSIKGTTGTISSVMEVGRMRPAPIRLASGEEEPEDGLDRLPAHRAALVHALQVVRAAQAAADVRAIPMHEGGVGGRLHADHTSQLVGISIRS